MQDKEKYTREMQRRFYGERYVGASISQIKTFPDGSLELIAKWIQSPRGFLIILGSPGTGKTHFCAAMLETLPKGAHFVRAYSERGLLQKVRGSFNDESKGDYARYLEYLLDDDLIIIDDIGATGRTDWREEILFEAVDYRYSVRKPTILTSNLSKDDLAAVYSPRLKSRLMAKENTVIELFGLTDLRQEGL